MFQISHSTLAAAFKLLNSCKYDKVIDLLVDCSAIIDPCVQVLFVGHSQGAPIATLSALDFKGYLPKEYNESVAVITFGTPRFVLAVPDWLDPPSLFT